MKFARFADEYAKRVAVNPANVRFVREPDNPKGPTYIELVNGRVAVMATFDEVVGGLEGVDAPPVATDPDLEVAARILDILAKAVTESDNGDPIEAARQALEDAAGETLPGAGLDAKWDGASARLEVLAARLRGRTS